MAKHRWQHAGGAASRRIAEALEGVIYNPAAAQFARPGNTTAYAVGDLVANDTAAANVTPLEFSIDEKVQDGSLFIFACGLEKSTATVSAASFRLHLFHTAPTVATAGDNAAFTNVSSKSNHIGLLTVSSMVALADGAVGYGVPEAGNFRGIRISGLSTIYGLWEARGAYAPGSAETFDSYISIMRA